MGLDVVISRFGYYVKFTLFLWVYDTDTHTHTPSRILTYHPELCVGVDLSVLVPSHTLVHSRVGQGQATY